MLEGDLSDPRLPRFGVGRKTNPLSYLMLPIG